MVSPAATPTPIVLKFGGSSVAETKHWTTIVEQLKLQIEQGKSPVLVLSALKDVSNRLEAILHQAVAGDFERAVNQLTQRHLEFARELGLQIAAALQRYSTELSQLCQLIHHKQQITPQLHASVLAIGELMSTTIGSEFIKHAGLDAMWVDARELLVSVPQQDNWHHFTSAVCEFDYCPASVKRLFENPNQKRIIVTQGFIAVDPDGNTVLLGREGSDTSAAYLAAMLGAEGVQVWTDVIGVYSANPADVPQARSIATLSYQQAHTMAKLGAKVLHPKVIRPLLTNQIPLQVKSTWFPEYQGTLVGKQVLEQPRQTNEIIAVMWLNPCIMVELPNSSDEQASHQSKIKQLLEMGFDLIIDQVQNESQRYLFKYVNSDQPMPSAEQLAVSLVVDISKLNVFGSLLSLLGSEQMLEWKARAGGLISQLVGEQLIATFENSQTATVSYFLSDEVSRSIMPKIHQSLVGQNSIEISQLS